MNENWAEIGIFTALETEILDTVSGGSVLDGLQLLGWSQGDKSPSNDGLTIDGGDPGPGWYLPEWGCQSPLTGATPAHYHGGSPLCSIGASDTIDEVVTT